MSATSRGHGGIHPPCKDGPKRGDNILSLSSGSAGCWVWRHGIQAMVGRQAIALLLGSGRRGNTDQRCPGIVLAYINHLVDRLSPSYQIPGPRRSLPTPPSGPNRPRFIYKFPTGITVLLVSHNVRPAGIVDALPSSVWPGDSRPALPRPCCAVPLFFRAVRPSGLSVFACQAYWRP